MGHYSIPYIYFNGAFFLPIVAALSNHCTFQILPFQWGIKFSYGALFHPIYIVIYQLGHSTFPLLQLQFIFSWHTWSLRSHLLPNLNICCHLAKAFHCPYLTLVLISFIQLRCKWNHYHHLSSFTQYFNFCYRALALINHKWKPYHHLSSFTLYFNMHYYELTLLNGVFYSV